jgi:hypothetical protein
MISLGGVLRLAVAKGPVLLLDLNEVNDHVLSPMTEALI